MAMILKVYVDDGQKTASAAIAVPDIYVDAFEPINTTDDPLTCLAGCGVAINSRAFIAKRKLREDSARTLADELAKVLLRHMEQYDYHNGYRNKPDI